MVGRRRGGIHRLQSALNSMLGSVEVGRPNVRCVDPVTGTRNLVKRAACDNTSRDVCERSMGGRDRNQKVSARG